jgi:hypothetical protein
MSNMKASFGNKRQSTCQKTKEKCTIDVYVIVGFSWEPLHET